MAQKNTSGANSIPRLVVRIIGSKQVKQFIEEPHEYSGEMSKKEENPPVDIFDDDLQKPPRKQEEMASRSHRQLQRTADSGLWPVINQVPDRLCVTAPPGDRYRSYIHPKTTAVITEPLTYWRLKSRFSCETQPYKYS